MSFGMSVFRADGNLTYSTDDVTWNQVDFFYAPAYQTTAYSYSVLSGRQTLVVQMFIDPPPNDRKAIAHSLSVSGTTVSASGGSENAYILVLMR